MCDLRDWSLNYIFQETHNRLIQNEANPYVNTHYGSFYLNLLIINNSFFDWS